jgi:flagellar hook assembly protein FlgD
MSCYPNPFSDRSTISIKSSEPGFSKLDIYNIKGQLIRSYGNSSQSSGDHTFHWDGRDDTGRQVSGGIYFAVVEAGRNKASSKILYLK